MGKTTTHKSKGIGILRSGKEYTIDRAIKLIAGEIIGFKHLSSINEIHDKLCGKALCKTNNKPFSIPHNQKTTSEKLLILIIKIHTLHPSDNIQGASY